MWNDIISTNALRCDRVTEGESFFNFNETNKPKCYYGSCNTPTCLCLDANDANSNGTCTQPNESNLLMTTFACSLSGTETYHLFNPEVFSHPEMTTPVTHIEPVWPTRINKITETAATDMCTKAINSQDYYDTCQAKFNVDISELIHLCVLDIQVFLNWSFYSFM